MKAKLIDIALKVLGSEAAVEWVLALIAKDAGKAVDFLAKLVKAHPKAAAFAKDHRDALKAVLDSAHEAAEAQIQA